MTMHARGSYIVSIAWAIHGSLHNPGPQESMHCRSCKWCWSSLKHITTATGLEGFMELIMIEI